MYVCLCVSLSGSQGVCLDVCFCFGVFFSVWMSVGMDYSHYGCLDVCLYELLSGCFFLDQWLTVSLSACPTVWMCGFYVHPSGLLLSLWLSFCLDAFVLDVCLSGFLTLSVLLPGCVEFMSVCLDFLLSLFLFGCVSG